MHINSDNPLAFPLVLVLFVAGLVVYPYLKTARLSVTPAKCVAVGLAIGICIYSGTLVCLLAVLWPLSFIWFPKYWGNYTGFLRGPYIDEQSPPLLISLMGWFFLVTFPVLYLWISYR